MQKSNTTYILVSVAILLVVAAGWLYWYFLMGPAAPDAGYVDEAPAPGFQPLDRPGTTPPPATDEPQVATTTDPALIQDNRPLPDLRILSSTPVGGYGASTTATTTVVRWVDRGRGNIYEATDRSAAIATISNTIVPRIYESIWNRNLTGFIGSIFEEGEPVWTGVYTRIIKQAPTASTSQPSSDGAIQAPYTLQGKELPYGTIGYASSPQKDKVFVLVEDNGMSSGYVSNFDGTGMAKIFTSPLTQINVEWPSDNIIAITTKSSSLHNGFLYFVNPKTGAWTKILGPLRGLSAKVSVDGKNVLYSTVSGGGNVSTAIYSIADRENASSVVRTLADKCAWGNLDRELAYCAAPSQPFSGTYPDDWYRGSVSSADRIWRLDASTGEAELISSLIDQSDRVIDAFNLGLDPRDRYLLFMNKNDLSLWSLSLPDAD